MSAAILSFVLLLFSAFQEAPSGEVQSQEVEEETTEQADPPDQDPAESDQADPPDGEEQPPDSTDEIEPPDSTEEAQPEEEAPSPEQADPPDQDSTETDQPDPADSLQPEDRDAAGGVGGGGQPRDSTQTGQQTRELVEVPIWPTHSTPAMETVETDSTLRWLMALEWTERLSRIPGSVAYRTGSSVGRPAGIHLDGFETRHQRLYLDQIELTDPVTGQVFWSRVPYHNIRTVESQRGGANYETVIQLRDHYLVQPRTYLNFDEGAGNYRHLEFAFTHNLRPRTNLELAFWDRRDGSDFRRSDLEGRQLSLRIRHHLGDRWLLKGGYLNNALDQEESFGYQITDPLFYGFNPFLTSAVEGSASANRSSNDLYVQMFHRPDGRAQPVRAAGVQLQGSAYDLTYSRDTTAYALQDLNLFAWQELHAGEAKVRVRGDAHLLREREARSLPEESWMMWEAQARAELPLGVRGGGAGGDGESRAASPGEEGDTSGEFDSGDGVSNPGGMTDPGEGAGGLMNSEDGSGSPGGLMNSDGIEGGVGLDRASRMPVMLLYGNGGVKGRSDGQAGFDLLAGARWSPGRRLSWDLSVARAAAIPTLQSLYWQSAGYAGNEGLQAEQTEQIVSEIAYRMGASWELGVRGGVRMTDQAALLEEVPGGVDGTGEPLPSTWAFVEADPYETIFGSAWIGLDSRHWEAEMSATVRELSSASGQTAVRSMVEGDPPMWLKGELFWKGNVFSSAAYVKGGLRGMWTPGGYRPAQFHVPMNMWQSGGTGDFLGDFSRLDFELSSRIRWFMLLVRYENLLDGVTQRGYFEADRYPMPGRRLIVSLRILFTN